MRTTAAMGQIEVETPYVSMLLKDDIMYCKFADELKLNLRIARLVVAERMRISQGKKYPCIFDLRGLSSVTRDARHYLATEGSNLVIAGALLVKSNISKTIGNIFLTLNKPKVPAKIFTDRQSALKWVKTFGPPQEIPAKRSTTK